MEANVGGQSDRSALDLLHEALREALLPAVDEGRWIVGKAATSGAPIVVRSHIDAAAPGDAPVVVEFHVPGATEAMVTGVRFDDRPYLAALFTWRVIDIERLTESVLHRLELRLISAAPALLRELRSVPGDVRLTVCVMGVADSDLPRFRVAFAPPGVQVSPERLDLGSCATRLRRFVEPGLPWTGDPPDVESSSHPDLGRVRCVRAGPTIGAWFELGPGVHDFRFLSSDGRPPISRRVVIPSAMREIEVAANDWSLDGVSLVPTVSWLRVYPRWIGLRSGTTQSHRRRAWIVFAPSGEIPAGPLIGAVQVQGVRSSSPASTVAEIAVVARVPTPEGHWSLVPGISRIFWNSGGEGPWLDIFLRSDGGPVSESRKFSLQSSSGVLGDDVGVSLGPVPMGGTVRVRVPIDEGRLAAAGAGPHSLTLEPVGRRVVTDPVLRFAARVISRRLVIAPRVVRLDVPAGDASTDRLFGFRTDARTPVLSVGAIEVVSGDATPPVLSVGESPRRPEDPMGMEAKLWKAKAASFTLVAAYPNAEQGAGTASHYLVRLVDLSDGLETDLELHVCRTSPLLLADSVAGRVVARRRHSDFVELRLTIANRYQCPLRVEALEARFLGGAAQTLGCRPSRLVVKALSKGSLQASGWLPRGEIRAGGLADAVVKAVSVRIRIDGGRCSPWWEIPL